MTHIPSSSLPASFAWSNPAPLPVLFVWHSSPMFALEAGDTGQRLPTGARPAGALSAAARGGPIMSPHWMARGVRVMATRSLRLGTILVVFPHSCTPCSTPHRARRLWRRRCWGLCRRAGPCRQKTDVRRPLDHGAWVPLMHLFPQADVPVVQVALPVGADAHAVRALARPCKACARKACSSLAAVA